MHDSIFHRCFKLDKNNAQAMISGFKDRNGSHRFQAIYCDVNTKPFPMLITLNRSKSTFRSSEIGIAMNPESFDMPYKYVAYLDTEYFIQNKIELWNTLCNNGLFDIWMPESPFKRFENSKDDPNKYRIFLLRIYEIDKTFPKESILHTSSRVDHIIGNESRIVNVLRPIIDDETFSSIKSLLKTSIGPFYTFKDSYYEEPESDQSPVSSSLIDTNENHTTVKHPQTPETGELKKRDNLYPDEVYESLKYPEGAVRKVYVNAFERNKEARKLCIEHFGAQCRLCSFDFEKMYGEIGRGFIHVHHIIPLSKVDKEYEINPIKDLIPVCPNCHAMLHTRQEPSIDELEEMIISQLIDESKT